jgi:hypothetical protein
MPRQNRVTPFGEIIARPERGTFMGNRGRVHDPDGRVTRQWRLKAWLVCLLDFNGRRRQVMAPNRYTELFFLDEATAFAAGHRPCWECRRKAAKAFLTFSGHTRLLALDKHLHEERLNADQSKRTFQASLRDLPDGTFVTLPGERRAYLIWNGLLHPWSPGGYGARIPLRKAGQAFVLTPKTIVKALRAGYVPRVHESVEHS